MSDTIQRDGTALIQSLCQRVLTLEAPNRVRFVEKAMPDPGRADIVVRSLRSAFKHGTEMMAFTGRSPFISKAFNPELRLFEPRAGPHAFYPRLMGNMVVGEVEWVGRDVHELRRGQFVFAWAPISDIHVLPAAKVRPLGDLTPEQALCIDPASFALGGVIDGGIERADTVFVTGLGAIGLFVVQYCVAIGARVLAASSFASRRELARGYCAEVFDPATHDDLARHLKERIGGASVAIECSGSLASLNRAIRATRQSGRVVCVGFYGPCDGTLNLSEEFFHNRLTLLASLPAYEWKNPVRGSRPLYAQDLQKLTAIDFLEKRITSDGILNPTIPFDRAPESVQMIADSPERVIKVVVKHD